ncbi:hypothetical protein A0256_03320 [Mucilaginibacter sp. PAMC 26640]|nr:hypothetical protein A0256_03320 [Mucilaginibacter sp. PAMC 26640]
MALEMFGVEILQLIAKSMSLQNLLENEEKDYTDLTPKEQQTLWAIILELPDSSQALKQFILKNGLVSVVPVKK